MDIGFDYMYILFELEFGQNGNNHMVLEHDMNNITLPFHRWVAPLWLGIIARW